ncbi:hypothetical protein Tco_0811934 [Tanacetum coccineum]
MIHSIMKEGVWISDPSQIKEEFLNFFKEKFKTHDSNVDFPHFAISFGLCALDRDSLETPISLDEVKNAVWDCGTSKAPGPDGFSFAFVKKYWNDIKVYILEYVNFFLDTGSLPHGSNSSFFTLIPKVFYLASGLKINIQKSNVYGLGVSDVDVSSMASNSGCASGSFPFTYIGLPIGSNMSLTSSWQVVARVSISEKDTWVGDSPFYIRYNRLYRLEREKDCLIIDRINNGQWRWNWSSSTEINEVEDTCVWSLGNDRTFSVKDARCIIDSKILPFLAPSTVWDKNIPRKAISCPSCNSKVESSNHTFFECNIAKDIWMLVRNGVIFLFLFLLRMSIRKVGFLRGRWLKRSLGAYQFFFFFSLVALEVSQQCYFSFTPDEEE